jgi:hypothetical protein
MVRLRERRDDLEAHKIIDALRYGYGIVVESEGGKGTEESLQRETEDDYFKIHTANLAMWLARNPMPGFTQILRVSEQNASRGSLQFSCDPHLPWKCLPGEDESEIVIRQDDLLRAKDYYGQIVHVDRQSPLCRALGLLYLGITSRRADQMCLLFWVALEALFSPSRAGETTFRMAQRIGFFLGTGDERKDLFERAKKAYNLRSRVVHGDAPDFDQKGGEGWERLRDTRDFLRNSIVKIVQDPMAFGVFATQKNDKKREKYLDSLVFG